MSDAKFNAAREFINEKRYAEARMILKTMNHPTATRWLARLDEIDPSFPTATPPQASHIYPLPPNYLMPQVPPYPQPSEEQERFYRRENRNSRLRRVADGLHLFLFSGVCFLMSFFFGTPNIPVGNPGYSIFNTQPNVTFVVLGVVCIFGGLFLMFKRD
ncbi:MAG: hypothetical protein SF123_14120 [Chloroflexota bacterium]|nr:hypothetical protein [Chloroflexota bacterium]